MHRFAAPWWLPDGHSQTVWSALCARRRAAPKPQLHREHWHTPDDDTIVVDRLPASQAQRPLLVHFHGLEGSSASHYAQAMADWALAHDWHWVMPHFRGCGGPMNRAPRAYHSGDHAEIDWILQRLRADHRAQGGQRLCAVGVSLGGNALMRWAGERGQAAAAVADAVVSVCAPLDLSASGQAMGQGFNRQVYTRVFLRTMKPKAEAKWRQHPGLFDLQAVRRAQDLYAFDNAFTAPLHGFANTEDYWRRASAQPHLPEVRIPALVINARNDPFVPAASLPTPEAVGPCVTLWQPEHGGHVGFVQGAWPGHVMGLPQAIGHWLSTVLGQTIQEVSGG